MAGVADVVRIVVSNNAAILVQVTFSFMMMIGYASKQRRDDDLMGWMDGPGLQDFQECRQHGRIIIVMQCGGTGRWVRYGRMQDFRKRGTD